FKYEQSLGQSRISSRCVPQHAAQMRAWSAGQKRFSLRVSQRVQFKPVGSNGTYHIQVRPQLGLAILFVEKWLEDRGESFAKVRGVQPEPNRQSEASTMNRVCSIFSQLLQLFSRVEFEAAVRQHKAERHARGFTCWGQFVAMLFCQLGRAHSLREICGGLRSCEGKLSHLGISAPNRSTLAYANEHRPWQLYRAVFHELLARCQPLARGRRKFRFKNKLVSLDSTVIDLCASLFDWAKFRQTKGAVKLHLLLDHDGYLPSVVVITEGRRHDVRVARQLRFDPGTILILDRGYVDYAWFGRLTTDAVFFVTRLKDNAVYEVVERRRVPEHSQVHRDEVIRLAGTDAETKCPHLLRRVEVYDPEKDDTLVFLTNHRAFGAT